ncbi:uncharacterized protein [Physcomitrium patens]|uniref:uncharacterized protein isoform X2 n=1 Tax=Physcomitrium patens TaxID=3218 RepID=UPI003CCCC06F
MGRSADSHHPSRPHIKCSTTSNIRKESLLDKLFANITPTIVDVVLPSVRLRDELQRNTIGQKASQKHLNSLTDFLEKKINS